MPIRPSRRCSTCHQLVQGRCRRCTRQTNHARGTRQARGYDDVWLRLRAWQLQREPLCRFCADRDVLASADQVDHIIPFTGIEDPRRLDPDNLRSLCASCHATHTRQQAGVSHHQLSPAPNRAGGSFVGGQVRWRLG